MRVIKILSLTFSAVGIALLFGSFFIYTNTSRFIARAARAEGRVVALDRSIGSSGSSSTYRPVVEFTSTSGRRIEFTSSVGSNPPAYRVGEPVAVLYDPSDPYQARIKSFFQLWFGFMIVFILGAIFAGIGLTIILVRARRKGRDAWLERNGRRIQTTYKGVELNQSLTVNGRSPYHILSQLADPATNTVHVFHSENIWFDPSEYIKGQTIDVLVDPHDPKKYYMDIRFLPTLAE